MRRRLKGCLFVTLVALTVVCALAWALITQPLFLGGGVDRGVVPPPVDPDRLRAHVRTLSEDFFPRDITHPENLDAAAGWITDELLLAGGRVHDQIYTVEGRDYRNVIARFGPADGERIVVGAHYDAFEEMPGADDNASAVAGLLELARLVGRERWPLTVELVAYSLEEPPKFRTPDMGSARHARGLRETGTEVRLMICLEMIGYFTDAPSSQSYPVSALKLIYPERGDFIAVIGKLGQGGVTRRVKSAMAAASPLPVVSMNAPASLPGVDFSDHLNYWAAGYDAVMITDTAFYRNPHYHEPTDTWGTLDYARMADVVRGVYAALRACTR
ncbi:M28 family peptidase [bacterium]|nr:M28 family peptidase [bacterium]